MIGEPRFADELLRADHPREAFICTREPALQDYLVRVDRAMRENGRVTAVYVLVDRSEAGRPAGYFTLSPLSVAFDEMSASQAKRLPRYPVLGALRLGRMARDDRYAGTFVGRILVARAFARALEFAGKIGSCGLVVDAKNASLARYYTSLGFLALRDRPLTLFITNRQIARYVDALQTALEKNKGSATSANPSTSGG